MISLRNSALAVWGRLLGIGFRLLYNELAWLYDPVSSIVSLGRWQSWQSTIWPLLPAHGRILEVGSGPGHLLADLASGGYRPVGLDLSPAMLRLAGRRLQRRGLAGSLCRGRSGDLPFAGQTFEAIITTFPTSFVYEPAWIDQLRRVLKPGGRLVVVEMALLHGGVTLSRPPAGPQRRTGQRTPAPDLARLLSEAGLTSRRLTVRVNDSIVGLVVAEKSEFRSGAPVDPEARPLRTPVLPRGAG